MVGADRILGEVGDERRGDLAPDGDVGLVGGRISGLDYSADPVRAANEAIGQRIVAAMKGAADGGDIVDLKH